MAQLLLSCLELKQHPDLQKFKGELTFIYFYVKGGKDSASLVRQILKKKKWDNENVYKGDFLCDGYRYSLSGCDT